MSFQAYLDNIAERTGKTPAEFIAMAKEKGFDKNSKAGPILAWLEDDYGLGRGHGLALYSLMKNGPQINSKHVKSGGVPNDPADTLILVRHKAQRS